MKSSTPKEQPEEPEAILVRSLSIACAPRWLFLLLLTLPALVKAADYNYTIANKEITITGYNGTGGAVTIPSTIDGLPVTTIGDFAFFNRTSLTSVTISSGLISIGTEAFIGCTSLTVSAHDN